MTVASVSIGVQAPESVYGDVVAGDSGLDMTTVTGVSLDVLDPSGVQATWSATIPAIPPTWSASTAYSQPDSGSAASITHAGGTNTVTSMASIIAAMVGLQVTIGGSTTPANNGTFPVASYVSGSSLTYADASGANDASGAVTWSVPGSTVVPPTANGFYYQCTSNVPATWVAGTGYAVGAVVSPTSPTGYVYQCIEAGVTGSVHPTFPTTIGQSVADNTAVWICYAVVGESAPNAPAFPANIGQTVVDGALVWKCAGPVTTPSALRWTHVFASSGLEVVLVGAYQIRARLTVPGGTVRVPSRTLVATGIYGNAI